MKILLWTAAFCLAAAPAFANARLIKSSPANGARIKAPHHIVLTFSEPLEPAFSGALLLDQEGRNLTGEPVKIDARVITLSPGHLAPGPYMVTWHSVGHEGKRLDGRLHFTVRS